MKNTTKATQSASPQPLQKQLALLLADAKKAGREIDEENKKMRTAILAVNEETDTSVHTIDRLAADLDEIEKNIGNELDLLMLTQAEDLASE